MSVFRDIDICCDGCDKRADCSSHTVAEARRLAREWGWRYRKGRDLCYTCATGEVEEDIFPITL